MIALKQAFVFVEPVIPTLLSREILKDGYRKMDWAEVDHVLLALRKHLLRHLAAPTGHPPFSKVVKFASRRFYVSSCY